MKILKSILLGFIVGILCLETGFLSIKETELSQIVMANSYAGIECYPAYIGQFTFRYIPLFVFQIIFSTYIYKHFCSGSIYFFSRELSRGKWIIYELIKLYVHAVTYVFAYSSMNILIIGYFSKIKLDAKRIILLLYHIIIYSLYLMWTTTAINIISIKISGQLGFACIQTIIMFSVAIAFAIGNGYENGEI